MAGSNVDFKRMFYMLPTPYLVLDKQLNIIDMNDQYLAVTKRTRQELIGRYVFDAFPEGEERLTMFRNAFLRAVAGEANAIVKSPFSIPRPESEGGGMREVWWTCHHMPAYDADGNIVGMVQKAVDQTAEVMAERMRDIISREFDHRVKNLLTTVGTIARRTAKTSLSTEDFIANFEARINAMARTHQLLVEGGWDGMSLFDLLSAELKPYVQSDHCRVAIEGPPVTLTGKQAETLGLAFHELATNAAKYGALKDPNAALDISWRRDAGMITIDWSETGLHGLVPPTTRGFGSVIIEKAVPAELSGSVERDFRPRGLHCRIEIPQATAAG
ncbi:MAG: HWE histidine kinase domain-containing protein [Pseudolabrys sp.]|nr:HWE histidine kinase domain-containing protein [Pseudolabrys sp.]